MSMEKVKQVSRVAKPSHGVAHSSTIPSQQRQIAQQSGQHNRDMARINKLAERGLKK